MENQDGTPKGGMDTTDGRAPSLAPEALGPAERVTRDPGDQDAWEELDEHARDTQKPDAISALYLRVLGTSLSPELADAVGQRAVAFHDEWFEDPAHVIEVLRRVLELRPDTEWAFERLSLLLTMAERWEDLLSAYDAALAATSDRAKKKALLDEAARIAKDFAGSADRAVSYLKQLVPLRPEDSQLAQSLERRLLLQKRHRDLIDVWQARLHVLSAAEALAARVRIAETWLDKIGEASTALGVVRELIASGAGEAQAAGLLERIGTKEAAAVEIRREALQLLHDRLDVAGRAAEVVHAVELLLGVADGVEQRVRLRAEATSRLADLGREEAAVEHAAEWLVLSPARDVEARLRALADASSRWDRYASALERAAAATTDGAVRVDFLMAAAERRSTALGEPDLAIALYGRVLGDDSVSHAVALEGARRLVALLVGDEHRAERLDVLERLAALEGDAAEQRRVLGEAAKLARELGDVDRALGLWRKRREQDAADAEALDAIVELLGEHRRWDALVVALEQRAASGAEAPQRRADLVRIAEVQRADLDDLPRAIEAWRRVEVEFGANAESTDALADLSAAAERWSDVTQLLSEAARRADDPGRRAAHLARMGDVWRTQRSAPVRAAEAYREALEVLPVLEPARAGLVALLDDAEAGALAVETLATAHSAAGEWQGLLGLVERR
ncbi:MAG: hypothetical protein FJ104_12885, partial [Deltaproteobacteria bacterium]|nr:hypothetical protein [Deltaproteobacteria bacterium]